jgi:endonuclease/exonuclease/phosphatase family metal-dependent hydrolase
VTARLRVATWNIYGGRTWDGARVDLDLTLATLRRLDADLVALQEVDRDLPRSGGVDQARVLAKALGMRFRFAPALLGTPGRAGGRGGPGDPEGVPRWDGAWPVGPGVDDPGGPAYGIALLSRLPLGRVEVVRLPRRGGEEPRVAQVAEVDVGGVPVTVTGTHLSFVPRSGIAQLRALLRRLDGRGGRRLLLGDLNLVWPLVRVVALPGWRPLVRGGTFRNRPPGGRSPRVQLDHVLAAGRGGLTRRDPEPPAAHRARVVSGPASDHLAVRVELEWPA